MKHKINLSNIRFGSLVVLRKNRQTDKNTFWWCRCDCGYEEEVRGYLLKVGKKTRCRECFKNACKKNARKHGLYGTRFYGIWGCMLRRCNDIKDDSYRYYGKRGIKNEWESFIKFRDDMITSYKEHCKKYGRKNTTIERINNDENYSKKNCKWATWKEQNNNKRPRKQCKPILKNKIK